MWTFLCVEFHNTRTCTLSPSGLKIGNSILFSTRGCNWKIKPIRFYTPRRILAFVIAFSNQCELLSLLKFEIFEIKGASTWLWLWLYIQTTPIASLYRKDSYDRSNSWTSAKSSGSAYSHIWSSCQQCRTNSTGNSARCNRKKFVQFPNSQASGRSEGGEQDFR